MPGQPHANLMAAIPQSPFDSASGSARSAREVCELLARNGWNVRFMATTTSEDGRHLDLDTLRAIYGVEATVHPAAAPFTRARITFSYRGVSYVLLDSAGYSINDTRLRLAEDMSALILTEGARLCPAVLLTYGSSEAEVGCRARLRQQGTRVVFFLRNNAYFHERSFREVDAILTPSRYLSKEYHERSGVESVPLRHCINVDEVVAPCAERIFCTFINPSPEKGLVFFLDLVRTAALTRPDIPFLAVESRGSGSLLSEMGRALGIELENVNLRIAQNSPDARAIYALTRVLLVPSTAPDAGPRVVPEAQLNGIPVIGSDRSGVVEMIGSGGFALPVTDRPDSSGRSQPVQQWLEIISRLYDDAAFYRMMSEKSCAAAESHRNGTIARSYVSFFNHLLEQK